MGSEIATCDQHKQQKAQNMFLNSVYSFEMNLYHAIVFILEQSVWSDVFLFAPYS